MAMYFVSGLYQYTSWEMGIGVENRFEIMKLYFGTHIILLPYILVSWAAFFSFYISKCAF